MRVVRTPMCSFAGVLADDLDAGERGLTERAGADPGRDLDRVPARSQVPGSQVGDRPPGPRQRDELRRHAIAVTFSAPAQANVVRLRLRAEGDRDGVASGPQPQ